MNLELFDPGHLVLCEGACSFGTDSALARVEDCEEATRELYLAILGYSVANLRALAIVHIGSLGIVVLIVGVTADTETTKVSS